jgi:hypothetical protein
MAKETDNFRRELFSQIQSVEIEGLISISLVGSFQYLKQLEKINDVDLIVLVERLTPKIFGKINLKFEQIANNLSSSKIRLIVENKIGPLKPKAVKTKKIVQLHLLIYDMDVWKNKKSKTTYLDWVNFSKRLNGRPLKDITAIEKLDKRDVVDDLRVSLSNIKSGLAYTRIYRIADGNVITEKRFLRLSKEEYYESITYNVITSFLNYLRYFKPKTLKNEEVLLKNGKVMLPQKYYSVLENMFRVKKMIRKKGIADIELHKLKKQGADFINFLIKNI